MEKNKLTDITGPEHVQVRVSADAKTIWVNIDGQCAFRVCRIQNFMLDDMRTLQDNGADDDEQMHGKGGGFTHE